MSYEVLITSENQLLEFIKNTKCKDLNNIFKFTDENNAIFNGSIMMFSANKQYLKTFRILEKAGAKLFITHNDSSCMILACKNDNVNIVKLLLKRKININKIENKKNKNYLMIALENKSYNVAQLLIENKIKTNICDINGKSCLMYASEHGYINIVKSIVELQNNKEVYINLKETKMFFLDDDAIGHADFNRLSALGYACKFGHSDVVNYLLENKANIGNSLEFAIKSLNFDTIKLLFKYGAKSSTEYVITAIEHGNIEIVKYLIRKGIKVYKYFSDHNTNPLSVAIIRNNIYLVKCLVSMGMKINAMEIGSRKTIFLLALDENNNEITKYLLENGVDFNDPYMNYKYLKVACQKNNIEMLKMLKDTFGNNIKRNWDHINIFFTACYLCKSETIKWLFENYDFTDDENINDIEYIPNFMQHIWDVPRRNLSCLGLLIFNDNVIDNSVIDVMIKKGADINIKSEDNETLAIIASQEQNYKILEKFIKFGIDVNHKDNNNIDIKHYLNGNKSQILEYEYLLEKIYNEKSPFSLLNEGQVEAVYKQINIQFEYIKEELTGDDLCGLCWSPDINIKTECNHYYCHYCFVSIKLKKNKCSFCNKNMTDKVKIIQNCTDVN